MRTKKELKQKSNKRVSKNRRRRTLKTRTKKMVKGGSNVVFPPTISNASSPQSYLPYNNFENDPGYSVINARNTGAFLTGVSTGGRGKNSQKRMGGRGKNSRKRMGGTRPMRGGGDASSSISNIVNGAVSNAGIIPAPAFNELSGISGVMSGFSNTAGAYSSTPANVAPLA